MLWIVGQPEQLGKMESMIRNIDEILNQILEPKQA